MNTKEFKYDVAKKIMGVNVNIDQSDNAWLSASQFDGFMGWKDNATMLYHRLNDELWKTPWKYLVTQQNGRQYVNSRNEQWVINVLGIAGKVECAIQHDVPCELGRLETLFKEIQRWHNAFDAQSAYGQVCGVARVEDAGFLPESEEITESVTHQIFGDMRGYEKDGTVYLNLEDVARGLGFAQTRMIGDTEYTFIRWNRIKAYLDEMVLHHKWCKDGIQLAYENDAVSIGQNPQTTLNANKSRPDELGLPNYIPENIFYCLTMKAKNKRAQEFVGWLANEVIPSIRKTGSYNINQHAMHPSTKRPDWARIPFTFGDATKLLFKGVSEATIPERIKRYANAVRRLVPVIANVSGLDVRTRDVWRELYERAGIVGNADFLGRKAEYGIADRVAIIDLVESDEWWSIAFAITALCYEAGVDMRLYISCEIAELFERVWGYVTGQDAKEDAYIGIAEQNIERVV